MNELIGLTIYTIYVERDGQHVLAFDTSAGLVAYQTEGDCCSETWFSDIYGLDTLLGHTVRDVEVLDKGPDNYDSEDGRGRQEYDKVYGFKLTTEAGYADIVFRNSSNGYYYGWCERVAQAEYIIDDFDILTGSDWKA